MHPIPIPKELVNDDAYMVAEMLAAPGDRVDKGQPLAELETSKAAFTLVSPADGWFRSDFTVGDMVRVGGVFGHIADSADQILPAEPNRGDKPRGEGNEPDNRFSTPAWALFLSSGLPLERFLGMSHVRRSDVEDAMAARTGQAGQATLAVTDAALAEADRESVVLLGGGGHCRECIDIIESAGAFSILGVIDTHAPPGTILDSHPVLGDNAFLERLRQAGFFNTVLAYGMSGSQKARGVHFRELSALGHRFPAIVHAKAAVNRHAELGAGAQVMGGALVGSRARLGDACIVNSNAVVSHDCVLGSNVHVAPGALLAGGAAVGEDSVLGMGATVYMKVRIGRDVVVYNGANVFADVPDGMVVRGDWNG